MATHGVVAVLLASAAAAVAAPADKPNIVFVLTDDEDLLLGGASDAPLPHAASALRKSGATFENHFVHTPVCCPSRSEVLTGRYFHNLMWRPPTDRWDTVDGVHARQCMHIDESRLSPGPTFAQHLAGVGYKVLFVGKYLNISPRQAPAGAHTYMVNPGPASHSALDASGEYYPSFWYHITPTFNGTFNFSGLSQAEWYETAFIENFTVGWLREHGRSGPFFAYVAPHAPHGAAIPAPWYKTQYPNATSPVTPSFNFSAKDHHWLVAQQPPTRPQEVFTGNEHFRDRWRCLRSVDDLIVSLRSTLDELDLTKSTYMFFTSDHGFHFHQLRLGVGKWNVYDTDVRVHLHVTGPGVVPSSTVSAVTSHVDLAPTWLALAGLPTPADTMDGRSFAHELVAGAASPDLPLSVRRLVEASASAASSAAPPSPAPSPSPSPRPPGTVYIEYHGLENFVGNPRHMDSLNNTYRAVRVIAGDASKGIVLGPDGEVRGNLLFAEFGGDYLFSTVVFEEVYDYEADPWAMRNIVNRTDPAVLAKLRATVRQLWQCEGDGCR